MSQQEQEKKKEHWSRHPAFLILLPLIVTNFAALVAAIKYATVQNIPLFILIWFIGAILSFIAGIGFPIYIIGAAFSQDLRKKGYFKFVLSIYLSVPKILYEMITERFTEKETKSPPSSLEQQIKETAQQIQNNKGSK